MSMLLVPVPIHASGPLTLTCKGCARQFSQASEKFVADLNGEPFVAYYCENCQRKFPMSAFADGV